MQVVDLDSNVLILIDFSLLNFFLLPQNILIYLLSLLIYFLLLFEHP